MTTEGKRRSTAAIHARIKTRRKARGLSQEELGAKAVNLKGEGVDKTAVSHWENGISSPDIERLPALAAALEITVDELLAEAEAEVAA